MSSEQTTSQTEVVEQPIPKKIIKIKNYKKLYENEFIQRKNVEIILEQNKKELEQLKKILNDNKIEIETLKQNLEIKNKELTHLKKPKGSQCSVEGNKYEKKIYNVVKYCTINEKSFNTQKEEELGGSSSKNDIECTYTNNEGLDGIIGIEVKKKVTPDWMQCSIIYNKETKKWEGSKKCKIPPKSQDIFIQLIKDFNIFDGGIPPFMQDDITHEEWLQIKKDTKKWNDQRFDIPNDTIRKLYREKGCQYIQISDGYGLYHLGEDVCNFSVPVFDIEQELRIRTKIHERKNKQGFCKLSVTIAAKPKNIKSLNKSPYSLDDENKLPVSLIYKS